jgi:hypothetical protein
LIAPWQPIFKKLEWFMKALLNLSFLLGLAACTSDGEVVGFKPRPDAASFMLSSVQANTLSRCVSEKLHATAEFSGSFYLIRPSGAGASYYIRKFDDKYGRYVASVEIVGMGDKKQEQEVATCLLVPDGNS